MKKNILMLLIAFCFLNFNIDSVNAVSYSRGSWNSTYGTYAPKTIDGNWAFCSNHSYYAPPSGSPYYENSSWRNSNSCAYTNVGSGVDCSIMVGYIISEASSLAYSKGFGGSVSHYVLTQMAIQSYLYKYSNGVWSAGNVNYLNYNVGGITVSTVVALAWSKYQTYLNALSNAKINTSDADNMVVTLKVDSNDNKLYFNPNNKSYYSYKITTNVSGIKNLNTKNLKIDLYLENDLDNKLGVRFCSEANSSWDKCSKSLTINNSTSGNFYLISKTALSGEFQISARASYNINGGADSISYSDTRMYNYAYASYRGHSVQKFLTIDTNFSSVTLSKTVTKKTSMNFSVVGVKLGDCSNLYNGYDTSKSVSRDVICQNNKDRGKAGNTDATFKSCSTRTIKLSYSYKNSDGVCVNKVENAQTSIAVGQDGYFNFGEVKGDTAPIVKGQGFYLKNVYYTSQVSWKNALTYSNGDVYYWLPNSGDVHHNTYVYPHDNCSGNAVSFDTYAKNYTSTYKVANVNDNDYDSTMKKKIFQTYNNTIKLQYVPDNIIKEGSISNVIKPNDVSLVKYVFNAPNSYLEIKNGDVYYNIDGDTDNNYSKDEDYVYGGKRYYTIFKYPSDTFPFNIKADNLSAIDDVTWKLNGVCDIDLDDSHNLYDCTEEKGVISCQNNYDYRTISVNNPFPKVVASNWVEYYNSSKNMARLKSTFANGESGRYYSVSLTRDKVNKIIGINESDTYTTFKNINNEGISSVINDANGFTIFANGDSFCKLGEFNASCDKLK